MRPMLVEGPRLTLELITGSESEFSQNFIEYSASKHLRSAGKVARAQDQKSKLSLSCHRANNVLPPLPHGWCPGSSLRSFPLQASEILEASVEAGLTLKEVQDVIFSNTRTLEYFNSVDLKQVRLAYVSIQDHRLRILCHYFLARRMARVPVASLCFMNQRLQIANPFTLSDASRTIHSCPTRTSEDLREWGGGDRQWE